MTTTRDLLVVRATELLDLGGVENVTLRQVGARAGVSHNAPYKHFADKQALLEAVAAAELDSYARLLRRAADLDGAMRAYIRRALRHPERFRLVYGPWTGERAALGRAADDAWGRLTEVIIEEQARDGLPQGRPERLANLLRSLAHGAIELALAGHLAKHGDDATPESLVEDLLGVLRAT